MGRSGWQTLSGVVLTTKPAAFPAPLDVMSLGEFDWPR